MYLWKVDDLVEDFKSGNVSQKEELKYMVVSTIFLVILADPYLYIGMTYNSNDSLISIFTLLISIYGLYACYKINSSGDNKDYIARIMCIGLPAFIRLIVIALIPLMLLVGFLDENTTESIFAQEQPFISEDTSAYMVAAMVIYMSIFYLYLAIKIKAVSSL